MAFLQLRGRFLCLGGGKLFVLPSLFARCARKQRFALFDSSMRIAARSSMHFSRESTLDGSNPRD